MKNIQKISPQGLIFYAFPDVMHLCTDIMNNSSSYCIIKRSLVVFSMFICINIKPFSNIPLTFYEWDV